MKKKVRHQSGMIITIPDCLDLYTAEEVDDFCRKYLPITADAEALLVEYLEEDIKIINQFLVLWSYLDTGLYTTDIDPHHASIPLSESWGRVEWDGLSVDDITPVDKMTTEDLKKLMREMSSEILMLPTKDKFVAIYHETGMMPVDRSTPLPPTHGGRPSAGTAKRKFGKDSQREQWKLKGILDKRERKK